MIAIKKHTKTLLIAALIISLAFGYTEYRRVNNLKSDMKNAESLLINGFYLKPNLSYLFDEVKNNPPGNSLEVLSKELASTQHIFASFIELNRHQLNDETWNTYRENRTGLDGINFISSLTSKKELDKSDKEKLEKMHSAWNQFYNNVRNDTSLGSIININSLTKSYTDFLAEIDRIAKQ